MSATEQPVQDPTWMKDIRFFFDEEDKQHMQELGIDLRTYDGVKSQATSIYFKTQPPTPSMPPPPKAPWSQARSDTFKNWIVNGYPFGTAVPQPLGFKAATEATAATRVRKDIRTLSQGEIDTLKKAWNGILGLGIDDPNSYFAQAAIHWLPPPTYCLHHESRYNPWHRSYVQSFEDALRSIPGCSDVTLPYWDITTPVPDLLFQPPFDKYTLPKDIGGSYKKGYVTQRFPAAQIEANLSDYGVAADIEAALGASAWEDFNGARGPVGYTGIMGAHDSGHVSCGNTMAAQDVAAYDPIFWFFHANWDRLWWKWQVDKQATTLPGFISTLTGAKDWLLTPPFNALPPFKETSDKTIDLVAQYDADYAPPPEDKQPLSLVRTFGSVPAAAFRRIHSNRASVRVKGIDRLSIPGSFTVHLKADGATIARRAIFQAMQPRSCSACVKQGLANIDLTVDVDQILGKRLSVALELADPDRNVAFFPLSSAGNPTINVRLLLE